MAKQIKRSEIAEEDLYKEIRISAEKTIKQVDALNESLSDTANVLKKELNKPIEASLKSINDLDKNVKLMNDTIEKSIELDKAKNEALKVQIQADKQLKQAEKERLKQQKEADKLNKQFKENTDEMVKAKIRYQKATNAQKKALADELILNDKNAGTLEKLAAQSRKLRREREKLNLDTEQGVQRLKEINDQLDANNEVIKENSDKLKQQKLNVGNYTESIENATGEIGGLIKSIRGSIKGIKNQITEFRNAQKQADSFRKKAKLLGKALKGIGIGAIIALLGSMTSSIADTRKGTMLMQGTMAKVTNTISVLGSRAFNFFESAYLNIQKLGLQIKKALAFMTGGSADIQKEIDKIDKRLNKISEENKNLGFDQVEKSLDNLKEYRKALYELENQTAMYSKQLAVLQGEEERLEGATGDMTLSFRDQTKAQDEYNKKIEERIGIEKELAKLELREKILHIQQQLINAGGRYTEQQIENLKFLEDEEHAIAISSERLSALAEAKSLVAQKDQELLTLQEKNATERRNTEKDLFEKQLDYAIDAFDVNKTINERIINLETTTLAERDRLTEMTRMLSDKAFKNQIKLVEDYTKQRIDFDKLIALQDEEAIRRELDKNNLNETTLTRILEIIKERKLALQDLSDLELETANKRFEMNQRNLESEQAIEQDNMALKIEMLQNRFDVEKEAEEKLFEVKKSLYQKDYEKLKATLDEIKEAKIQQLKDIAEFEIQQAKDTIIEEDEKAQKIEEIIQLLANDIQRIEQDTLNKKRELDKDEVQSEKEKADKLKELQQKRVEEQIAILEALTEYSNELADKRISKIDEEIEASQRRFDTYSELASQGNILAKESLAEEQRLIDEANRKKEQAEKRKQRVQLASSVLQTYLTNSADPDVDNPLAKTITDTVLLTEFIKSLPTFMEGIEDTGNNGRGIDGKGGFLSVLHPNERVVPKEENQMIGDLTNSELAKLAYKYQTGMLTEKGKSINYNAIDTKILADKLESLENTIRNKPETNIELEQIVGTAMAITRTTKQGNTKIYNRYRV